MNDGLLDRIKEVNDKPINDSGKFILYWMIATRRFNYNASLEFALTLSQEHRVPLIVIEEISTSPNFPMTELQHS